MMNSRQPDDELEAEDFQGGAGYMKYQSRARAVLAARRLGGEGAHSHGTGPNKIHMPGGEPGSIGPRLKANDLPKPDHSSINERESDSGGMGMSGGMGGPGGGSPDTAVPDPTDDAPLYAGGPFDITNIADGSGGDGSNFLRPRNNREGVEFGRDRDTGQFAEMGDPVPLERDRDSGRVGPDPFAVGNFGRFNSPYDTNGKEEKRKYD